MFLIIVILNFSLISLKPVCSWRTSETNSFGAWDSLANEKKLKKNSYFEPSHLNEGPRNPFANGNISPYTSVGREEKKLPNSNREFSLFDGKKNNFFKNSASTDSNDGNKKNSNRLIAQSFYGGEKKQTTTANPFFNQENWNANNNNKNVLANKPEINDNLSDADSYKKSGNWNFDENLDNSISSDYDEDSIFPDSTDHRKKYSDSSRNDKKWSNKKPSDAKKPDKVKTYFEESSTQRPFGNSDSSKKKEKFPSDKTSILDELDKNDWYFGSESNFPEVDVNSNLNINVDELWNLDKKKMDKGKQSGRRKNRAIYKGAFCECVDFDLCDDNRYVGLKEPTGNGRSQNRYVSCERENQICCTNVKFMSDDSRDAFYSGAPRETIIDYPKESHEFPWILKLETIEEDLGCGASLINDRIALTAAHCVDARVSPDNLFVRSGTWASDTKQFQVSKVNRIIMHPGYNRQFPRNDVALLILDQPFRSGASDDNMADLPVTNDKWDSENCIVGKWKRAETGLEVVSSAPVKFLPQHECQKLVLATEPKENYVLHDSFVCAVEKNEQSSCLGKEGTPVMCPSNMHKGKYLQIGLVTESLNCENLGKPGIVTNLLKFLDWTNDHIINENFFHDDAFEGNDERELSESY